MLNSKLSIQDRADSLAPTGPQERVYSLDVIRGFALLGVLLAYALWNLGSPPGNTFTPTDQVINFLMATLVDTKALTLFATLFGLGLSIQMGRAESRGISFTRFYSRRLAALLLIGLAHALLLRNGDILVPYALLGFIILPFRNASKKTLFAVAAVGLLLSYFGQTIWQAIGLPFPSRPNTDGIGFLASNLTWFRYWYLTAFSNWPGALPMIAFGIYLGRNRFYENVPVYRKRLWLIVIGGFVVGLAAMLGPMALQASGPLTFGLRVLGGFFYTIHGWAFAAFYGCALLLLVQRPFWQKLFAPVAAVGRMALTNYLLQAALIVPVCIFFGLFDRVTPTIGLMLAAGVWALQLPFSMLWLSFFNFGPAEWLWRSLTYGRLQPMQRMELSTRAAEAAA